MTSGPHLLWAFRLRSPSRSPELHDCFLLFMESSSRKISYLPRLLHLSQCQLRPQSPRSRYLGSSFLSFPSTSMRGRAYWICLKYGPSLSVPIVWKSHVLGGSPQPPAHSLCSFPLPALCLAALMILQVSTDVAHLPKALLPSTLRVPDEALHVTRGGPRPPVWLPLGPSPPYTLPRAPPAPLVL